MMDRSTLSKSKKKRGRPTVYAGREGKGAPLIGLRVPPGEMASIEGWIKAQPKPRPSRPEAIRRLAQLGLAASILARPPNPKTRAKAADMAGAAIDRHADPSASSAEQASRKRRLLKGPKEFRELRRDHQTPKRKP
jgi:hypothetical protein